MHTNHVNLNFQVALAEAEQREMTDDEGRKFTLSAVGCDSYNLKRGRVSLAGPGIKKDGTRALVNRSMQGTVEDLDPGIRAHIDRVLQDLSFRTAGGLASYMTEVK